MAKKKGIEKPKREMTRRQLSMWQKQQRRHRIIKFAGFGVLAAAIVLVLVGLFVGEVLPRNRTVIRVYDAKFSAGYYLDSMKIAGMLQQTDSLDSLASTIARK